MRSGNIFLNYRRDDTAGHAGRLFDRLNHRFPGRIFRDVTGIAYGLDFSEEIERKLASCQVLIVLIGKHWLTLTNENGYRRLNDEHDFVRLEVASGLRRNIRVIPVLVGGARMPRSDELPKDLRPLVKRNALEITEPDFDNDVARLIQALEEALGERPKLAEQAWYTQPYRKTSRVGLFVGLGAAALAAVVIAILMLAQTPKTKVAPPPTVEVEATPALADEEFFNPVGEWGVEGRNLRARVLFAADGGYRADTIFERQRFLTQGNWGYNERARVLTMEEFNAGTVARAQVTIEEKHGSYYTAVHSFYGPIRLYRLQ
jgi:TIR domain